MYIIVLPSYATVINPKWFAILHSSLVLENTSCKMPSLQDVWETVLFSPLNLLTEAVSERFLKREGCGGSRAAKRQNTCYPLVHSIHHAQTHTWTPGWGVQGGGKNKRLESQDLFLILYCTCSQGNSICGQSCDQQKPKAKEYCYFFWCSGCPNRSWGWTVVQGLGLASGKGPVLISLFGFFICWKQKKNFPETKDAGLHCCWSWQNSCLWNEGLGLQCAFLWIFKKS